MLSTKNGAALLHFLNPIRIAPGYHQFGTAERTLETLLIHSIYCQKVFGNIYSVDLSFSWFQE